MLWFLFRKEVGDLITVPGSDLVLREPHRRDMRQWIALRTESQAFLQPWEPKWPEDDLSQTGFLRRLRSYSRQSKEGTAKTYFLFGDAGRRLIGGLSLTRMDLQGKRTAMLGYWMGERHAGKGQMGKAISGLLDHAFRDMELEMIEAACLPGNGRSIHLLEKAGFSPVGIRPRFLEINGVKEDHLLFLLQAPYKSRFPVDTGKFAGKSRSTMV